jgi:ABC-type multidrug transport system fused ATPase/permease subunit
LFNYGAVLAAVKMHDDALLGLVNASLEFFEKTSSGRILNRFSRDIDATDNQMAECSRSVVITAVSVLATILLTVALSWPSMITVTPTVFFFYQIQKRFRPPAREIKRLDALTKAPIFSHISESLNGVQSIRAFRHESRFIEQLGAVIDKNSVPVFLYLSLQRWVSIRLEMVGNLIILSASLFGFATANIFSFTGLSIVYALNTTGSLNWLIRRFSELESQMISCERLLHYSHELLKEEDTGVKQVENSWPSLGEVLVEGLTISYRSDRPPALVDLTLDIKPGEHIGIVGRTGAGKSTIISAFFRLYNASTSGRIVIDGMDISEIPLSTLRQRLAIIPQDPILFSGTVRSNLDPFSAHNDDEMWLALERSGLAPIIKRNPGGLDATVDSHGENWSAGERQLLCLARALLAKSRIILMDEATSSVDPQTDSAIQECIAKDLEKSTVLIVAHRLNTIMHCHRVIVLEAGRIIEQGDPQHLAQMDGPFAMLLRQQHSGH